MNKEILDQLKEDRLKEIKLRFQEQHEFGLEEGLRKDGKIHVMVCGGTGCQASESLHIKDRLNDKVKEFGLKESIEVNQTGCFGLCEVGPNIVVYPQGVFYCGVHLDDVDEIVESHFKNGNIVERLVFGESKEEADQGRLKPVDEVSFYKRQVRISLRNCGKIDPENIEDYIAIDGYQALEKTLHMSPDEVIKVISDSGLRGRGGAGFPTGKKWEFTKLAKGDKKYVVCNADEGDPGAFMDRSILEGDPNTVIEAMAIAAYAIGADEGYIYIRAEYPIAVRRLEIAIRQAEERGFLGDDILGSGFSFKISLRLGAGAFVCGEETALIESIEGNRGIPRNKPPFPANSGVWNKPTLINNVETYANIPSIINKGAEWFRSIGTKDSPGTKVFSLGGKVKHTGLIEVPMGMTFREIVYDIGGGIPGGKKFKAIQTGGPSGGCIPEDFLDTPVEYETLKELGSMMGSGGMIVIDEDTCVVDLAKFYMDFLIDESCGKCTPCREGTTRLYEILDRITKGKGKPSDIEALEDLGQLLTDASLCGLGKSAANPVLSTLRYFMDEYKEHIEDEHCRAGKCRDLTKYFIEENCIGCGKCKRECPVSCIDGKTKERHVIDQDKCIRCGTCRKVCPIKPKAVVLR
ncbi:MAG: NADH-quinone oxidoreductase subunit NuoF [Tissierellia bacterium]|nr:NADH-quinone oxidoreductase subunit NuoF [Tissierellia bacterium]